MLGLVVCRAGYWIGSRQPYQIVGQQDWKNQYPGIGILKSGLQLIDLDWRAGISVATDSSKNLNVPYIQLLLKFVNPQTGNTSDTTISLDYQSFIAFLRDVRKINGLLATYN